MYEWKYESTPIKGRVAIVLYAMNVKMATYYIGIDIEDNILEDDTFGIMLSFSQENINLETVVKLVNTEHGIREHHCNQLQNFCYFVAIKQDDSAETIFFCVQTEAEANQIQNIAGFLQEIIGTNLEETINGLAMQGVEILITQSDANKN